MFADALLQIELPALPAERRGETVRFIERRMASLPDPVSIGVGAAAAAVRVAGRLAGYRRVAAVIGSRALPVFGDYARLVRSLGFAFVWETWPGTQADGAPG
jgi:hypothetical protein